MTWQKRTCCTQQRPETKRRRFEYAAYARDKGTYRIELSAALRNEVGNDGGISKRGNVLANLVE